MPASASSTYYCVIVGSNDAPLYELFYASPRRSGDQVPPRKEDVRHLQQFIAHAALDVIDEYADVTTNIFLKNIDKFNEWNVSAHVMAGVGRIVILHTEPNVDGLRIFLNEVYDLTVKITLNPFYAPNSPIKDKRFAEKVKLLAKRYLV